MANKSLFTSIRGFLAPKTDTVNAEGAPAYALGPKAALAQFASTGCLNGTFYATAEEQLAKVLELAGQVEPEFVAKTAVFARERGFMKDTPALLAATLTVRAPDLFRRTFPRVIDDGRTLRTFVQIMRSGTTGRKSLGTLPKRAVLEWLAARSDEQVFRASVGSDPSLADVVKMVHPKPATESRKALYGWMIGRDVDETALPGIVARLEAFKRGRTREVPDVPFTMLSSLGLGVGEWRAVARNANWQITRANLNTFARHGVFDDAKGEPGEGPVLARIVADRLRDRAAIAKSRVLPYQILAAWAAASEAVPADVKAALGDAAEIATGSVPSFGTKVVVCPDVSGSMQSAVTGSRGSGTSKIRCIDVAALVAAAVLRRNDGARVIPFSDDVVPCDVSPSAPILATAQKLAALPSGGTNCSAPLRALNAEGAKAGLVIYVSDNESWVDAKQGRGTALLAEWRTFAARNPGARLVCIDIQPYGDTQAPDSGDVLNVGGFSDRVFEIVADFASGRLGADAWVRRIEETEL